MSAISRNPQLPPRRFPLFRNDSRGNAADGAANSAQTPPSLKRQPDRALESAPLVKRHAAAPAPVEATTIAHLPPELLEHVLSFSDNSQIAQVCKLWKHLADGVLTWRAYKQLQLAGFLPKIEIPRSLSEVDELFQNYVLSRFQNPTDPIHEAIFPLYNLEPEVASWNRNPSSLALTHFDLGRLKQLNHDLALVEFCHNLSNGIDRSLASLLSDDLLSVKASKLRLELAALQTVQLATTLDFEGLRAPFIPSEISLFRSANSLNWRLSDLTTFPAALSTLPLRNLFVRGNEHLTELPDSIGDSTGLVDVDLSATGLHTLPPSIQRWTLLTTFTARDGQLTRLPDEFASLTNLVTVILSGNSLSELPNLGGLTSLVTLDVANNRLAELSGLGGLTNLTRVIAHSNRVRFIAEDIIRCVALLELDVSNNLLALLPDLTGLENLSELNVSNNILRALHPSVGALPALTVLKASNNQIRDLPPLNLPNVTVVDVSKNQIRRTSEINAPVLSSFAANENQLTLIPSDLFWKCRNLVVLLLGQNQIGILPVNVDRLAELELLSLGHNRLRDLPSTVANLPKLTSLFVDNNQISRLPPAVGRLDRLITLHLQGNRLTTVPNSLGKLASIYDLDLRGNPLVSLPESVQDLWERGIVSLED